MHYAISYAPIDKRLCALCVDTIVPLIKGRYAPLCMWTLCAAYCVWTLCAAYGYTVPLGYVHVSELHAGYDL